MKKGDYLPHPSKALNDPKLFAIFQKYGAEGYGWYWILLELMQASAGYKLDLREVDTYSLQICALPPEADSFIADCIDIKLFQTDGTYFWSMSLCKWMEGVQRLGAVQGKGRKRTEYPEDSQYYKMALYFKQKVDEMAAAEGLTHLTDRTNLQKWADDFRKLVELDKHSDRDLIKSVMDWVIKDDFWKGNVMSAETFRKHFPKLVLEMRKKPGAQRRSNGGTSEKPKLTIVQSSTPDSGNLPSDEEYAEMLKLAKSMQSK